jgi:hypothetical protein
MAIEIFIKIREEPHLLCQLIRINSAKLGNLKSLTVKVSVLLLQNFIVHVRVFIRYSYLQNTVLRIIILTIFS